MEVTGLNNLFTEEPLTIAKIGGYDFILRGISYGNVLRISNISNDLFHGEGITLLSVGEKLLSFCKIIAIACYNKQVYPPEMHSKLLLEALSIDGIALAIEEIYKRISINELWNHYGFKSSTDSKSYPGSGSPWSTLINSAIASKGWSEHSLKWEISFQNLVLYTLCIPSIASDSKDAAEPDKDGMVDMFAFFENKSQ